MTYFIVAEQWPHPPKLYGPYSENEAEKKAVKLEAKLDKSWDVEVVQADQLED